MLIKCPECGKEISDKCVQCIHCGYPLKQGKRNNDDQLFKVVLFEVGNSPVTCMRCLCENLNITLAESKQFIDGISHSPKTIITSLNKYEAEEIAEQFIKEGCTVKVLHNGEQIESKMYAKPEPVINDNTPKCPTCGSTNINKISSTAKVTNTVLFGLFGTKRHYQWHCNDCGSDF